MKTLKALMLVLALSVYVYAGEMDNGKASTPPPAPTSVGNMPNGLAGDMDNGVAGNMDNGASVTTGTSIAEIALNLLESVLSVF